MSSEVKEGEADEVSRLQREVEKLRKINRVLMDRVERNTDWQGNGFSMFQAAIVLEGRVEERSIQLEAALRQLEAVNQGLSSAKEQAETAQRRLREAIESISEGFALFDADDRLALWNNNFVDLMSALGQGAALGTPFAQVIYVAVSRGTVRDAMGREEEWIAERIAHHRRPDRPFVYRRTDGRWLQVNERRTHDGGTVAIYTDITEIKQAEKQLRQRELAKKSELLLATLESLSQGVAVFDRDLRLAAWNQRYLDLHHFKPGFASIGTHYADFLRLDAGLDKGDSQDNEDEITLSVASARDNLPRSFEHILSDGRVVEVASNTMPDGGLVNTYSDITERKRADLLLRDSERRLQAAALKLQRSNESLERRVKLRTAELSAVNEALHEAKVVAEQANVSKTKFLAAASHDLHQPLNAARLFAAALGEREDLDKSQRDLVLGIDNSLEAINALLRALFDISKLDAGVMSVEVVDGTIGPLLEQLWREYMPQTREIGLDMRVVSCGLAVRSDPRLLARILRNFLSNALRYTEQGRILLGCRRLGNALRIEVWDTGLGIASDRISEIFQEFHQISTPGRLRDKGLSLGLGLSIVERIAQLLHHPITVRSELGRGSCFAVEVPIAPSCPGSKMIDNMPNPVETKGSLTGLNVMVFDDDPAGLEAITALLSAWGCRVTSLGSGAALEDWLSTSLSSSNIPDMIISDYHLGDGDNGLGLVARLRGRLGSDVPAFIVSSDQDPVLRATIKAHGLSCLNKPLAPPKMRSLMTHLLSRYRASR